MKTHLDLFSGIGGFALAAQWNGLETIGFSEIEPYACKVLAQHWPGVPNLGDIRAMAGVRCDLITGGFPCQPFSCAGKRRGKEDDRHLWPEMLRVIAESRPTWVLCENVPGIIKMELDSVLTDLEAIGYACWPCVIPACAVDARHQRKRLWIVAHTGREHEQWWTLQCREKEGPGPCDWTTRPSSHAKHVANRHITRLEERSQQPAWKECETTQRSGEAVPANPNSEQTGRAAIAWDKPCEWEPEPELGRVAHGIPSRAHRLRGLGNSIVPQVAAQLIRFMIQSAP